MAFGRVDPLVLIDQSAGHLQNNIIEGSQDHGISFAIIKKNSSSVNKE